nr:MAG TPA: hypothetical protein [Caudoviricetes sp.]
MQDKSFDKTSANKTKSPTLPTKQGIFCKIKSGTAHRQCRSLQRP